MSVIESDWNYTGQPDSNPIDEVRELIGDVNKNAKLISDTTIDVALTAEGNNARSAAALVCEKIAARFMREASSKSAKDYSRTKQRADAYLKLASRLRKRAVGNVPQAAQLRTSTSERLYRDADIRRGAFRIGMFHNREHDPRTQVRDEDLLVGTDIEESTP